MKEWCGQEVKIKKSGRETETSLKPHNVCFLSAARSISDCRRTSLCKWGSSAWSWGVGGQRVARPCCEAQQEADLSRSLPRDLGFLLSRKAVCAITLWFWNSTFMVLTFIPVLVLICIFSPPGAGLRPPLSISLCGGSSSNHERRALFPARVWLIHVSKCSGPDRGSVGSVALKDSHMTLLFGLMKLKWSAFTFLIDLFLNCLSQPVKNKYVEYNQQMFTKT